MRQHPLTLDKQTINIVRVMYKNRHIDNIVPKQYYLLMPPKIRELIKKLEKVGFSNRGGKGSHRNYIHPKGIAVTISGKLGEDAKKYQENEVKRKIVEAQK